MAKLTTAEFIEAIKELTVLELNDLVKACEEEFGVSAAAGVVAVSYTHLDVYKRQLSLYTLTEASALLQRLRRLQFC